jgi:hypothetical protein
LPTKNRVKEESMVLAIFSVFFERRNLKERLLLANYEIHQIELIVKKNF